MYKLKINGLKRSVEISDPSNFHVLCGSPYSRMSVVTFKTDKDFADFSELLTTIKKFLSIRDNEINNLIRILYEFIINYLLLASLLFKIFENEMSEPFYDSRDYDDLLVQMDYFLQETLVKLHSILDENFIINRDTEDSLLDYLNEYLWHTTYDLGTVDIIDLIIKENNLTRNDIDNLVDVFLYKKKTFKDAIIFNIILLFKDNDDKLNKFKIEGYEC